MKGLKNSWRQRGQKAGWKQLFAEIDKDANGHIDFSEFKLMAQMATSVQQGYHEIVGTKTGLGFEVHTIRYLGKILAMEQSAHCIRHCDGRRSSGAHQFMGQSRSR